MGRIRLAVLGIGTAALFTACGVSDPLDSGGAAVLWEVPGEMSMQPLVADSLLIAPLVDGRLVAFRRRDGTIKWQRDFRAEFRGERLLRLGSVLIVPHISLHGVDARTGALLWTYGGNGGDAGVVTPGLAGDTLFVAGYNGGDAAAINATTGRVYWETNLTQTVFRPTVAGNLILYPTHPAGRAGALVAVDRASGQERWRRILPDSAGFQGGAVYGGVVAGDRVILGTFTSRVLALRLPDGALLWERLSGTPANGGLYRSQPRLFGGNVVLMRGDGVLEGRTASDGNLQWSTSLGGSQFLGPSSCAPYLCQADGRVWIFDQTGKIVWAFGGGSEIVFLSNVTVDPEGIMYAGIVYQDGRTTRIRAFRPPVVVGPTP